MGCVRLGIYQRNLSAVADDDVLGKSGQKLRQSPLMDAGAVEKFAVSEIKHFGGIFDASMLPNVTIISLPVSLMVLVDQHWIVWVEYF